jgi:hypothetical protein
MKKLFYIIALAGLALNGCRKIEVDGDNDGGVKLIPPIILPKIPFWKAESQQIAPFPQNILINYAGWYMLQTVLF